MLILIVFLFANIIFAQNVVENFKKQYESKNYDHPEKITATTAYIFSLFSAKKFDKAKEILNDNIAQRKERGDYKSVTILYCIEAMSNRILENTTESKKSIQQAIKYSDYINDSEAKGFVAYSQGWIYSRDGEQSKAVKYILDAIKLYDKSPKSTSILKRKSSAYNELSVIYADLGEDELDEKYSKIALSFAEQLNEPQVLFTAYMKMGNLYNKLFDKNASLIQNRNLAEKYFLKSIEIFRKNESLMSAPTDLSYAANNLASLYLYSYPENYHDKGLHYAKLANEIAIKYGQADQIASTYGLLSEIELSKNNSNQAIVYLFAALDALQKSSVVNRNIELNIYESLAQIFENKGNYQDAVKYYKEYVILFKALYDQEKLEISKRLESQFEKEIQKQHILTLQLESDKKAQKIDLMQALGIQQEERLKNLKLQEEYQREKLRFSELKSEKSAQQLKYSRLEMQQKNNDIINFKRILAYKEKINRYYITSIFVFILLLGLLLYAYKQRIKSLKQTNELHALELEKEKQNTKISTLTALLEGQEKERSRLARDLHDGLGGLLSSTKLHLTHLNNNSDVNYKNSINNSISQIDGAVDELRRVAHNLMPDLLIKYGLEVALKEFSNRMSNDLLDIDVQFFNYNNSLTQDQELIIYRIIQELVNNAIKHSSASLIIIQLTETDNMIFLTVEDDGKGFNIKNINIKKSAGFINIQSRVEFLKGKINIQSEENIGTSIEIQLPIQ
ncbi:sensor histidine kinase [Faecalibacter sp. WQ 117]|uniref:histidine kinase n=1 Tax=Faecalibacter rhinopitheci TaxID=2779678 RepID=A0A8J7FQN6_9FLAO|nr:sensor histidine kinase [Faecalibacter rhinopitheci]